MIRRFSDWEVRLTEFLALRGRPRFRYGVWDCGIFAAGAIASMTGVDLLRDLRGRYRSRRALLDYVGGGCSSIETITDSIARAAGCVEIAPPLAHRGDLAAIRAARGDIGLGIMALDGRGVLCLDRRGAIQQVQGISPARAWRI